MQGRGVFVLVLVLLSHGISASQRISLMTEARKQHNHLSELSARLMEQNLIQFLPTELRCLNGVVNSAGSEIWCSCLAGFWGGGKYDTEKKLFEKDCTDVSGQCKFGVFTGNVFGLTTTGITTSVVQAENMSSEKCAAACGNVKPDSAGEGGCELFEYNSDTQLCTLVTALPQDFHFASGVCIKRGGCFSNGGESCVFKRLDDTDLSTLVTWDSIVAPQIASSDICEARCDSNTGISTSDSTQRQCVAYTYDKTQETCTLYIGAQGVLEESGPLQTGICARGPAFELVPMEAWGDEKATFAVSVPSTLGSPIVHLEDSEWSDTKVSLQARDVRAHNQMATFSDVLVEANGRVRLQASVPGAVCPALSPRIRVKDKDMYTFFFWNKDFDSKSNMQARPFMFVRYQKDCSDIVGIITIFMIVLVVLVAKLISKGLTGNALTGSFAYFAFWALILGLIMMDFITAFQHWNCGNFFEKVFLDRFNTYINPEDQ